MLVLCLWSLRTWCLQMEWSVWHQSTSMRKVSDGQGRKPSRPCQSWVTTRSTGNRGTTTSNVTAMFDPKVSVVCCKRLQLPSMCTVTAMFDPKVSVVCCKRLQLPSMCTMTVMFDPKVSVVCCKRLCNYQVCVQWQWCSTQRLVLFVVRDCN